MRDWWLTEKILTAVNIYRGKVALYYRDSFIFIQSILLFYFHCLFSKTQLFSAVVNMVMSYLSC